MRIRKIIFIQLNLLFALSVSNAQIGIQTESPLALVHIDSKKNTNPAGTINTSDDIVVDNNGNVGVGILSPLAKLHIKTTSSVRALRISDGTQGNTKILSSDALGNASWVNQPSSSGAVYRLTGTTARKLPFSTISMLLAMPITESGNYLVIIRWWGISETTSSANTTSAYLTLDEAPDGSTNRGTVKDNVEYYVYTYPNNRFSFTTSLYGHFQAGSYLKLFIYPAIGTASGSSWVIGSVSPTSLSYSPSIVIFKV